VLKLIYKLGGIWVPFSYYTLYKIALGANFGETEKRRISVSAEIRAEKFLAADIFFFGPNPKFGRNSASAKNNLCSVT
jgi:hypothetical protein